MQSDNIKKIIHCNKKYQLVVAAAGTGKTHTLIKVLAERIEKGIINPLSDKEKTIVFTFTNNAADELMVRLSDELSLKKSVLNRIFIGTIHGWCNKYLEDKGKLSNTKVIDELERSQLLRRIYPILNINNAYPQFNNYFFKIDKFENDLELFYNECLDLDDGIIPDEIRQGLKKYQDFIKIQRLLDFGSLIKQAIEYIKKELNTNFTYHIFVDEYQDVNPSQVKLIKTIIGSYPNSYLFAVGDPRQTIYQWRGSDLNRILNFSKDFEGETEIFKLNKNYRSRPGIINFANIISKNMDFYSSFGLEDMLVERKDKKNSVIIDDKSKNHEEKIIQLLKYLKSSVKYKDIAILMRSVLTQGKQLMELLDEEGIEYYSPNKNSGILFIQEFMDSIIRVIEIMANPSSPQNYMEQQEIEEELNDRLLQIHKYCPEHVTINDIHIALGMWYNKLSTLKKENKTSNKNIYDNESYNFRKQLFDFCKQIEFVIQPDQLEIQEGFAAITQVMRAIEEIYRRRFTGIKEMRAPPIDVFLNNIRWQLNNQIERWTKVGMNLSKKDKITISTVHAAKGLQWPIVIIPFLWKNCFPHKKTSHGTSFPDVIACRYGTNYEDEKRLFYVAATRPRDRLYMYFGEPEGTSSSPFMYKDKIQEQAKNRDFYGITFNPSDLNFSDIEEHQSESYHSIGVSNFLLLLECPYHFYLRQIVNINVPVGEEFGAGNILHRVVERVAKKGVKTGYKDIVSQETYIPLSDYITQIKIQKSIEKKVKNLIETDVLDSIDLKEYSFTLSFEKLVVFGIVDATRKHADGIEIIDWKSTFHQEFKERYFNQIKIYAYGLKNLGHKIIKGTIYDLSQEDILNNTVNVPLTEHELTKLMKTAKKNIEDINENISLIKPIKGACIICDVKEICPLYLNSN